MPEAEVFLDTNVLVYALSDAPEERAKRDQSANLLSDSDFGTSYQILMETWVVATRKMAKPVPEKKVAAFLERILVFPCAAATPDLYRKALLLASAYRIHPYDAAIVAAAHELGARTLYTEVLNEGQMYEGIQAVNPFAGIG